MKHLPIKEIKRIIEATYWIGYTQAMDASQAPHDRFYGNVKNRIDYEDEQIVIQQKEIIRKLRIVDLTKSK